MDLRFGPVAQRNLGCDWRIVPTGTARSLPRLSFASNLKEVLRPDLSALEHQLQPIQTCSFVGVRAAQRRSGRERAGKGDGRKVQLLNRVGGCIAAAENDAANAGLLDNLQEKAAEGSAKFLVKRRSRGRAQRGVKNRIAT
jgi:hypothetical protein